MSVAVQSQGTVSAAARSGQLLLAYAPRPGTDLGPELQTRGHARRQGAVRATDDRLRRPFWVASCGSGSVVDGRKAPPGSPFRFSDACRYGRIPRRARRPIFPNMRDTPNCRAPEQPFTMGSLAAYRSQTRDRSCTAQSRRHGRAGTAHGPVQSDAAPTHSSRRQVCSVPTNLRH